MTFDDVIAQPAATRTLRNAAETGRIAGSYLFEGPSGVGKERAAVALATAAICDRAPGSGCGQCKSCRRIEAGQHPDLRIFGPRDEGAGNIQVDFVRNEILPVAQYAPFEAAAAFLVFPRADVSFPDTHPESANALLKTLEEPRPGVHFVLLSERPDRLLPTIRSRCQSVRFSRLPADVLDGILARAGAAEADRAPAIALAGGRADRALALVEDGAGEALVSQALHVDEATRSGGTGMLSSVAEDLARSDDVELLLDTLATFYRDVAAAGLGRDDDGLVFRHRAAEVRDRATTLDPARAARRVELIHDAVDTFERNANRQIVLDSLLYELRYC